MAFPNQQLFLDRFIARNKKDYKDNPGFLLKLESLKLEDVVFSNFKKVEVNGVTHHTTDMEAKGVFVAVNQDYIPAYFPMHGVAILNTEEVLEINAISMLTDPGLYLFNNKQIVSGAVLVKKGERTKANVLTIIKAKSLFELTDADITINDLVTEVIINSFTIISKLFIVESKDPDNAVHDSTFLHDGTLTY